MFYTFLTTINYSRGHNSPGYHFSFYFSPLNCLLHLITMMPLRRFPTRPEIPRFSQPSKPKPRNPPKPKPKHRPRDPAPKSRVSIPHHRMADPAAAGSVAVVPAGGSKDWTPSFGDMVWGKVKSHPWWPGHVYSITLSDDAEVHRGHRHGLVLVAFFGDGSYGWFEPHELVRFEDHFAEKTSQGGSRTFPAAVAESLDEISRRSALALLCPCRIPDTFRPHNLDDRYLLVNVPGFDSNAEYLPDQVTAARERFVPQTMFDFLQNAAVQPRASAETAARTLPGIEMAAMLTAYRRARYERYDLTYAESFGVDPKKALEGEVKAENERSQRGIDTHMPNPSSSTIHCHVIVFAVYLNLMGRLPNSNCFDVNSELDSNIYCFYFVELCVAYECEKCFYLRRQHLAQIMLCNYAKLHW